MHDVVLEWMVPYYPSMKKQLVKSLLFSSILVFTADAVLFYPVFFLLVLVLAVTAFFLLRSWRYEFEYSYVNGDLEISKIIRKEKRKELYRCDRKDVVAVTRGRLAAGSRRVWELHGSVLRNFCMSCRRPFTAREILECAGAPRCPCGGLIKPDVVLYQEALDQDVMQNALTDIRQADLLIVGGTSLSVYPAAGLIQYYRGKRLVLINKSPTSCDSRADLLIAAPIGALLGQIEVRPL